MQPDVSRPIGARMEVGRIRWALIAGESLYLRGSEFFVLVASPKRGDDRACTVKVWISLYGRVWILGLELGINILCRI